MPELKDAIVQLRSRFPETFGRQSDDEITDQIKKSPKYGPMFGLANLSGDVDPRLSALNPPPEEQAIGAIQPAATFLGAAGGTAVGGPVGGVAGATGGGAVGRYLELKAMDALGIPRPKRLRALFGILDDLGESSTLKEMGVAGVEGGLSEAIPLALQGGARSVKEGFINRSTVRAAKMPINASVKATNEAYGLGLGADEISNSPFFRSIRAREAKTAVGATKAQIRAQEIDARLRDAVRGTLDDMSPPRQFTEGLAGELREPESGVLDKLRTNLRTQEQELWSELDKISPDKVVDLRGVQGTAREILGRPGHKEVLSQIGEVNPNPKIKKILTMLGMNDEDAPISLFGKKTTMSEIRKTYPERVVKQLIADGHIPPPKEPKLSFAGAQDLRSDLLDIARKARASGNGKLAGVASQMADETKSAVYRAGKDLPKDALDQWEKARAFTSHINEPTFKAAVRDLYEQAPSKLSESIPTNDVESARAVSEALKLSPSSMRGIRRLWTQKYFFGEGDATVSDLEKVATKMKKLSPEFVKTMYGVRGEADRDALDRLVDLGHAAERVDFELGKGASGAEIQQGLDMGIGLAMRHKIRAAAGAGRMFVSHFLVNAVSDPRAYKMLLEGVYEYPKNPAHAIAQFGRVADILYRGETYRETKEAIKAKNEISGPATAIDWTAGKTVDLSKSIAGWAGSKLGIGGE